MAFRIPKASSSISTAAADAKGTIIAPLCHSHFHSKIFFAPSTKPKIQFFSKGSLGLKAELNKVVVNVSPNDGAKPTQETKIEINDSPSALASKESISEFISQVTNLVKLVDSRDIVELNMKQLDCELLIRKKDAIIPTSPIAPMPNVSYVPPQNEATPAPSPAPAPSPTPAPSAPMPAKSSSHPPLKSPMAGTFYRSAAPGAPPFIKVGDKVQKGQVICIVEAMKLMNEIEADQSGTVTEIIAEDKMPVSVDTPLLVIQP